MSGVLNVHEVSDAYRKRGALRTEFNTKVSRQGYEFVRIAGMLFEDPIPENLITFRRMKKCTEVIAKEAKEQGYDEVTMPFVTSGFLEKQLHETVLQPVMNEFGIKLTLQTERFYPNDVNANHSMKTTLHSSVRSSSNVAYQGELKHA